MLHTFLNILLYSTIFILILIVIILFYYKRAFKYWSNLGVPHPKPSFPFGNVNSKFSNELVQILSKIYFEMKSKGHMYCGYYMFTMRIFMPISPNIIKHFLSVNFNCFNARGAYVNENNDPINYNLVTMGGEKWKTMKDVLSPTWTAGKVKMMFPLIFKCAEELEIVFDETINNGNSIDILHIARRYTADVICTCAFGIDGNCLKDPNSAIIKHGDMIYNNNLKCQLRICCAILLPEISKFFKISLFDPKATSFFQKLVYELVHYREEHNIERNDILNLLIRLKNNKSIENDEEKNNRINRDNFEQITIEQIAAQCFIFFLAGFETTSITIHFAMYELAKNQVIQEKCRQEVIDVLKKFDGEFSYDAVKEMHYLENVIYEALRKYPPVYMIHRICTENFTIPDTNITITKGTRALLSTLAIHMDPEYYPNAEIFDPDRFTDEAKANRPSYVYLPFGDGPRICPGLRFGMIEIKVFIAFLITRYKFNVHPSSENIKLRAVGNLLGIEKPTLLTAERL